MLLLCVCVRGLESIVCLADDGASGSGIQYRTPVGGSDACTNTQTYAHTDDRVIGRAEPQRSVKELPSCSITPPPNSSSYLLLICSSLLPFPPHLLSRIVFFFFPVTPLPSLFFFLPGCCIQLAAVCVRLIKPS